MEGGSKSRSNESGFCFLFSLSGFHPTLPGVSQGGSCGCAAVGQRPLPNAPHSKSPGQQHNSGTSCPLHLQLLRQQCLRMKRWILENWNRKKQNKKCPVSTKATRRHYTLVETPPLLSWFAREQRAWWEGGILKKCEWNQNDGWCGDVVVNVLTTIVRVVKMNGQSLAVGSVEPKELPICMH